MNKPNIIFYFSDQQRADSAGCYGQKLPVTPNLDAVAEETGRTRNEVIQKSLAFALDNLEIKEY